jgi:hypothetical protein
MGLETHVHRTEPFFSSSFFPPCLLATLVVGSEKGMMIYVGLLLLLG